jgi:hypothetical protein
MAAIDAIVSALQHWYQRHSICGYLAWQTWQRLAATTIQCWKQRIWLNCWFAQQALQRQERLRLQLLCHGALAYAVLVWGNCQPSPTPTNKTSNPKVLRHPFWDRGGLDKTIILVVAQVEGIGPVLLILEGGRYVCPLFLGNTDCSGSIGSFGGAREVNIYTLPPSPLCCLKYPTCLPPSYYPKKLWSPALSLWSLHLTPRLPLLY